MHTRGTMVQAVRATPTHGWVSSELHCMCWAWGSNKARRLPELARIWGRQSVTEGKAYLHLQMSGLGAALRVLRVGQAVHAEGQGDLRAQHAAAQEAGRPDARLQRAEAARQP